MIVSVTFGRVYNLGNYENLRLEATASVQDGNVDAAFDEARGAVEAEYTRQRQPQRPAEPLAFPSSSPPATPKQRNYIATLQDQLCWTSEQLAVYASEQGVDLVAMTMREASAFIDGMKRLNEERSATDRPPPLADGYLPF